MNTLLPHLSTKRNKIRLQKYSMYPPFLFMSLPKGSPCSEFVFIIPNFSL